MGKPVSQAVLALLTCVTSGGKVLACGDGVSGLLATQFAAHFIGRFERERPGLGAIALPIDDIDAFSGSAQETGRERFARPVRALGQAGDVLLAISASGRSATVLAAIEAAHEREMTVIALLGNNGGTVAGVLRETDVLVSVPHERATRVHELHLLVLHCLCDGVDCLLLGEQEDEIVG